MVSVLVALGVVFFLLLLAEFLRRMNFIKGELARKFVHMSVGTFVAFWPFFMTWQEIRIMCVAFIAVVIIDRKLRVFKAVHSVARRTVGDILFPIGIGLATFVSSSPWIFTVAILHLSVGDGMAAVVGNKYGKKYSYSILHQKKSWAGSMAFWLVSLIIISALLLFMPVQLDHMAFAILFLLPVSAAALESLSIFGMDNITVPVFIAIALSLLQATT
jgi:phytol kinase